jgi:S-adenosylmethionine-diacylgycerolhomoserine-N-methlytransferase
MRPEDRTNTGVRERYGRLARIYDWANLEGLLYSRARARAIDFLELRPGAKVLDVACGTGVNFARIEQRIGPSGRLVGVDLTPQMLARARARVTRHDWHNVRLYETDASHLSTQRLEALGALRPGEQFDAALCTLGLSVIADWERAWLAMLSVVRTDGRVAVMDAGQPDTPGAAGEVVAARPFALALGRFFAAACSRRPWEMVARDTDSPVLERFTWGYVVAAAGRVRSSTSARGAALLATATDQISELIGLLSTRGEAALTLPCLGRGKLGDGTVGAAAAHTAGSYGRVAAFLRAAVDGQDGHPPDGHDGAHRAGNVERDDLLERLSAARDALALLAELTDEQLDLVPAASEMKFCDGRRTLEQILSSLLKHQRHQVDAVKAAVG